MKWTGWVGISQGRKERDEIGWIPAELERKGRDKTTQDGTGKDRTVWDGT